MKKEDIEKVRKLAIAQLSKETGIADYFVQIDLQDEFVDRCIKIASQSKPQLNIENVVSGIVDSLGEPSNDNDYQIHSIRGERWITHMKIGSGEPLKQWLKSEIEKHIEQSKPQEIKPVDTKTVDAVEFLHWVRENDFVYSGGAGWYKDEFDIVIVNALTYITDAELLNLYIESKT